MKKQKPFFAKFLENQFSAEEAKQIKGGDDIVVTLKFPSDAEDGGGSGDPCPGNPGNATGIVNGTANSGNGQGNNGQGNGNAGCGPIFVTLKFPSDAEDTGGGNPI